jgi:hypothetical protein
MVDLPQHAAQLSISLHQGAATFAESGRFLVNWRTPYLGAYLAGRLLAIGCGDGLFARIAALYSRKPACEARRSR